MGLQICTRVLSNGQSLEIVSSMGVLMLTFQMSSDSGDSGTVTGNFTAIDADGGPLASVAQTIPGGGGSTLTSNNPQKPIDGVTLACVQGTMNVTLGF